MGGASTTYNIQYLADGGSDGSVIGKTAAYKLGFYGATPIAQQATTATDITTTGYVTGGVFSTSTLSINFINAVKEIQAALKLLGLIS